MDVAFSMGSSNLLRKGRGLGRGGAAVGPGRRLADDGKRFYSDGRCLPEPEALVVVLEGGV